MSHDLFHVDTPYAHALRRLFAELETRLALSRPVPAYLAGGMAVHVYTGKRVTHDVDAEFGARLLIPTDLMVEAIDPDGVRQLLYFDTNYNPMFALLHEDYQHDAVPLDLGLTHLQLRVLSPTDLAVSKIARFAPHDQGDIRDLVRLGLTTSHEIEARATQALAAYIGDTAMTRLNLRAAIALAREAELAKIAEPPADCSDSGMAWDE